MEEKISKKPYLKETSVSFLSEEWSKREEENPEEHRWYSVKIIIDDKYKTIKETYDIQMQKELKELNETIDKCYKNPFLLVKELVLNIALDIVIYPLKRFINKFKKG